MRALTKDQVKRVAEVAELLRARRAELENEVETFNAAVNKAWEDLQAKRDAYNEVVREAGEVVTEIHSDLENYRDERSEKWQDSEAGAAFCQWVDEWDSVALDEASFDEPMELEFDDEDYAEILESLPQEISS